MKRIIKNISELEEFARSFLCTLKAKESVATVVGLSGDLGSGKTAFVKAAAKALAVPEIVLSPTFVIAKFYNVPGHQAWSRLVHVDAYRIEDPSELKPLRWDSLIADPRNLVLVEWPEHIGALFPSGVQILQFRFVDETTRAILA